MSDKFDITPEKQASVPRFLYQQITFKPAEVRDVNLRGRTAIVTGSNTGVGFETSRQLLDLGIGKLILAVRNEDKGKAAASKLRQGRDVADGMIEVWNLDLSQYSSVTSFAERVKSLERLDYAVLNAGIAPASRVFNESTAHDEVIQVNYLSTALLAILLLPIAKAKRSNQEHPSRITIVNSEVAAWAKFNERKNVPYLTSLDQPGKVDMVERMFTSKLLGQFFVADLAKLVDPSIAVINAVSPATVHDTELNRDQKGFMVPIIKALQRRIGNSSPIGARMITDAVVNHGEDTHGQFLSFQKVVPMAAIVYTTEGKGISEQLWKETMKELSFANVDSIIKDMKA